MDNSLGKKIGLHWILDEFPCWQYENGLVLGTEDWDGEKRLVTLLAPRQGETIDNISTFTTPVFGFTKLAYQDRYGANCCGILHTLL
jgi:hypothetical protein